MPAKASASSVKKPTAKASSTRTKAQSATTTTRRTGTRHSGAGRNFELADADNLPAVV